MKKQIFQGKWYIVFHHKIINFNQQVCLASYLTQITYLSKIHIVFLSWNKNVWTSITIPKHNIDDHTNCIKVVYMYLIFHLLKVRMLWYKIKCIDLWFQQNYFLTKQIVLSQSKCKCYQINAMFLLIFDQICNINPKD